jgi:hypothetical protein
MLFCLVAHPRYSFNTFTYSSFLCLLLFAIFMPMQHRPLLRKNSVLTGFHSVFAENLSVITNRFSLHSVTFAQKNERYGVNHTARRG